MSTLYEITGQYLELFKMMESADNLEMKVITDTLDGMDGELEEKADGYAKIMAELDAEAVKFENEADRLAARAEQLHNRSKVLKDRLKAAMILCNRKKLKTDFYSFAICKNGGVAPMEVDEVAVPDDYMKKIPDMSKIREALTEGKVLPFATLKERGEHLRIK
ncbi:siphovirus Gp157 family protein [Gallintestinimicrobium propionicum]|uniref:Siphovirus Gp157 family protein n=1 Tax=Gallintestinimicrobium propionicum TaxID=2981770 RepID=A0AAE3AVJ7_9FIRM|nr:siphovirus Gp157 family protein [Gallintestinimicrobium propionicum]MCC2166137.1 siphovirus Gp157 family protein [Gallintestinimicrobium propionicum]